ncbi:MAG TPA: hypothetical protein VFQ53_43670 [Kofleriaceae bacterium]|nr:hypothetical protein [Kofleriaceae bacterium]
MLTSRALLVVPALAALVTARPADACGGYVRFPQPMLVTTHFVPARDGSDRTRMFILSRELAPPHLVWRQLAPMSYDSTQIADREPLDRAYKLTLVGPAGTRVVTAQRRAYLKTYRSGPMAALEIDPDPVATRWDFRIALAGDQSSTTWLEATRGAADASDVRWLQAQSVRGMAPKDLAVSTVKTTRLVTFYQRDGKPTTLVRSGERAIARAPGYAIGAIETGGMTFVLVDDNGVITSIGV